MAEKEKNGVDLEMNSTSPRKNAALASSQEALEPEEEYYERGTWGNSAEFILSCLGYAVGLGNVWRFPYMCWSNGGGAFLIPYLIMLMFVGMPVFFIELLMGQYAAEGPMTVFSCAPLFQGVGMGMVIISFFGSIYYNMIIAWALYYMFGSFTSKLPWDGCGKDFNTEYCYNKVEALPCEQSNGTWFNQTCYNQTFVQERNLSYFLAAMKEKQVSSPEEYFNNEVLARTDAIDNFGGLKWDLCLTLLLAWILCFLCIIKGIKSSGKVVYFTATFPYVVLIILFFRGVTLEGAGQGIYYYLVPDWSKLATPKVWGDAAGQIFFSLSVGMGGLMTFASYNKFHNNVFRDMLIVSLGNSITSIFAGFVVFSILGFMAHELGTTVDKVVDSGSGLAFIAYPEVVTRLPVSQLWSFLFFFMLLTLGLDSQFAGLENIQTAIVDSFTNLRPYKTIVAAILCVVMYILGLSMCTNAGIYWEELISYYSSGWSLVLIGLAEAIVFPWVYGADRLMDDLEHMVGFRPTPWYWWFVWKFVSPVLLIIVLIFNFIDFTPLEYGGYVMPPWAQALGWMMALVSVVVIPIFALYHWVKSYRYYEGGFVDRLRMLMRPTPDWKPSIEKGRKKPKPTVDVKNISGDIGGDNPAFDGRADNAAETGF